MTSSKKVAAYFYSLSWRASLALLLMVALLIGSGWYSYTKINALTQATEKHANEHLPSLELLNATQLSITRLANLSGNIANSSAPAEVRVLLAQVRSEIINIRRYLNTLEKNPEIEALNKVVDLLEPNIEQIGVYKTTLSRLQQDYDKQYLTVVDTVIQYLMTAEADNKVAAVDLIRQLAALNEAERQFEVAQVRREIQASIQKLKLQQSDLYDSTYTAILAGGGLFENRHDFDQLQADIMRLDTQNRILLGNVVDYGKRVYSSMEQSVLAQAASLRENSESVSRSFFWVASIQVLLGILLFVYFRYRVFARLSALRSLVSEDGMIDAAELGYFDKRNEIGQLVHQLDSYLKTIRRQQQQIANVSVQLENIIRQSQMRVAVLAKDNVLFCSESLAAVFPENPLTTIYDFPEKVVATLQDPPTSTEPELILAAFYDAYHQRWYDVSCSQVMWSDQAASLISFVDVTERIRVTTEFKRTLSAVENEAFLDPLTGLYNRKMLDKRERQVNSKKIAQNGFAVLLFDVDFFKDYNDHYGHLRGDEALKMVAEVLRRNCPDHADAIRFGGEEFVLLINSRDRAGLTELAHLVLDEVFALEQRHPTSAYGYLSLSCGIAISEPGVESLLACFDRADQCLYQAKNNGRNCVVVA